MPPLIIFLGILAILIISAALFGFFRSDPEYEFVDLMSTPPPVSGTREDEEGGNEGANGEDGNEENDFGQDEEPFLEFSRDACFGTCPVYTVLVFRNGKVVYDGIRHVPFTGKFVTTVSEDKITEYLTQAVTHNFWEMNSEYDDPQVTDLPASIITYRDGVLEKTVRARYNIPQNVTDLITYLHKEFDGLASRHV